MTTSSVLPEREESGPKFGKLNNGDGIVNLGDGNITVENVEAVMSGINGGSLKISLVYNSLRAAAYVPILENGQNAATTPINVPFFGDGWDFGFSWVHPADDCHEIYFPDNTKMTTKYTKTDENELPYGYVFSDNDTSFNVNNAYSKYSLKTLYGDFDYYDSQGPLYRLKR